MFCQCGGVREGGQVTMWLCREKRNPQCCRILYTLRSYTAVAVEGREEPADPQRRYDGCDNGCLLVHNPFHTVVAEPMCVCWSFRATIHRFTAVRVQSSPSWGRVAQLRPKKCCALTRPFRVLQTDADRNDLDRSRPCCKQTRSWRTMQGLCAFCTSRSQW